MSSEVQTGRKTSNWYNVTMPFVVAAVIIALPALFGVLASQSAFDSVQGFMLLLVLAAVVPAVILVPIWWLHEHLLAED